MGRVLREYTIEENGYPVEKITRMLGKNKKPAPLVMIAIDWQYKSIYNLTNVCGLSITAEPMKPKSDIIQCRKCQLFGHPQKNCHADYRCMKCASNHSTHLCEKSNTTAATCANCGGEHIHLDLGSAYTTQTANITLKNPKQLKPLKIHEQKIHL